MRVHATITLDGDDDQQMLTTAAADARRVATPADNIALIEHATSHPLDLTTLDQLATAVMGAAHDAARATARRHLAAVDPTQDDIATTARRLLDAGMTLRRYVRELTADQQAADRIRSLTSHPTITAI